MLLSICTLSGRFAIKIRVVKRGDARVVWRWRREGPAARSVVAGGGWRLVRSIVVGRAPTPPPAALHHRRLFQITPAFVPATDRLASVFVCSERPTSFTVITQFWGLPYTLPDLTSLSRSRLLILFTSVIFFYLNEYRFIFTPTIINRYNS